MHVYNHNLGPVIKKARKKADISQEELAEKLGVGSRHIMAIENEGKTPAFELLCGMIRVLNISADDVFYPEKGHGPQELDYLVRQLYQCNKRDIVAISAMVNAFLGSKIED